VSAALVSCGESVLADRADTHWLSRSSQGKSQQDSSRGLDRLTGHELTHISTCLGCIDYTNYGPTLVEAKARFTPSAQSGSTMRKPCRHETPLTMAVRRGVWAITSLAVPGWALAAPQGGQVVAGSASIAQQGTKTTITQSTAKSAIDWQSFSIGTNEYVQFVQPGTTSVTLNRVVGNDPSQLLGQMSANGQIFLVNPNGVYFGPNAVIDVAGLLATTFGISNDDFMTGRYTFARVEGRDPATVVNDGTINADGGYVILAGDGVANHGLIEAHLGDIVMASGQQVTLDLGGDGLISFAIDGEALTEIAGVENTGELYADGGRIFLTAKVQGDLLPTAVNHEGLIQARTVEERDGIVYLGGSGGNVMLAGDVDANAGEQNADGGKVFVTSTNDITVSDGAELTAQGSGSGDGGTIRLVAQDVLDIESLASITTEGGSTGQGGFVEVSGHTKFNMRGEVEVGSGGTLLIDPTTIIIRGNAACSPSCGSSFLDTGASISYVYEQTIEGYLNNNTDVVLVANNDIIGTDLTNGLDATGAGALILGIGTVSTSSTFPFLQPIFDISGSPVNCGSGGVCGTGVGSPYIFNYDPNVSGIIQLFEEGGAPAAIDVNGLVNILAGFNGDVVVGSVRGTDIQINGNILSQVATTAAHNFSLIATSGFLFVDGNIQAENFLGPTNITLSGNGIQVNGRVATGDFFSSPSVVDTKSISIDAGSLGSYRGNGLVTARSWGNGANASVDIQGNDIQMASGGASASAFGTNAMATVTLDGLSGSISAFNISARATSGDTTVSAVANGINVGNVSAFAGGGNSASINLDAQNGQFLWNGGGIVAGDFPIPLGGCSYGGPLCFVERTIASGSATITGLEFPSFPSGNGSASITISGSDVTLRSPFRSQLFDAFGAVGFVGAIGGRLASVDIRATGAAWIYAPRVAT
jgi:filamentous hemagglutinin family protein